MKFPLRFYYISEKPLNEIVPDEEKEGHKVIFLYDDSAIQHAIAEMERWVPVEEQLVHVVHFEDLQSLGRIIQGGETVWFTRHPVRVAARFRPLW